MPINSIICGILLIIIGVAGTIHGQMNGHSSPTSLIPAAFGIVLLIFGIVARMRENLRKHLMHAAILIALLGFIATFGRVASKFADFTFSAAIIAQLSMAIVCLVFVVLAIMSFVKARRN